MYYNGSGVSSFCNCTIKINTIKSVNRSLDTMNFESIVTILTIPARVDVGPHSNMVTNLETVDIGTNLCHNSSNLMSDKKKKKKNTDRLAYVYSIFTHTYSKKR